MACSASVSQYCPCEWRRCRYAGAKVCRGFVLGQLSPRRYSTEMSNEKGFWLYLKRSSRLPLIGSIAFAFGLDSDDFGGEDGWQDSDLAEMAGSSVSRKEEHIDA